MLKCVWSLSICVSYHCVNCEDLREVAAGWCRNVCVELVHLRSCWCEDVEDLFFFLTVCVKMVTCIAVPVRKHNLIIENREQDYSRALKMHESGCLHRLLLPAIFTVP
jgi:hypothetical protein